MSKSNTTAGEKWKSLYGSRTQSIVTTPNNETILFMPTSNKEYVQFMGIGRVMKISRGEKFDVVDVNFGQTSRLRNVIVKHNFARKQLITLKKSQYAIFYGMGKLYQRTTKKNHLYKIWVLFSYLNYGFYVPKVFDVKKLEQDIENGEETNQIDEMTEERRKGYEDIVNEILDNLDIGEWALGKDRE